MIDDGYGEIRTSYLTEEQIISEGFEKQSGEKHLSFRGNFKDSLKNNKKFCELYEEDIFIKDIEIYYDLDIKFLCLTLIYCIENETQYNDFEEKVIFQGECKSINEFRKILQLTGIK